MGEPKREQRPTPTGPGPANCPPGEGSGIVTATNLHNVGELHLDLSVRLLRLEMWAATYERDRPKALVRDYIRTAISLRARLLRVSIGSGAAHKRALTGLEPALGHSLRWAYAWAIDEVETLSNALAEARIGVQRMQRPGQPVMLMPASIAKLEALGEGADPIICELADIDELLEELLRKRHRIEMFQRHAGRSSH